MGGLDEPFLTREERDPDDVTASVKRKLIIGASLCFLFMLVEIVGGLVAHSIAIISDAAHMLSDVAGFLVGAMSLFLTSRAHDARYSFGYHRAEVLGAIASILIVWLMTGMLVYEAVKRMIIPEIVDGRIMFLVSVIGLVMNGVLMLVLGHDGHSHGGHGHSHGHGHGHGHGHAGGARRPPEVKRAHRHRHSHDHSDVHGHGHACDDAGHEHGHGHAGDDGGHDHGHSDACDDCGHDHGHGGAGHDCGAAHGHGHSHGHGQDDEGEGGAALVEEADLERSVALRAAMIHVIGDILQSVGVCIAAALIWAFSDRWLDPHGVSYWYRADPICTFAFSALVLWTSLGTMRDATHVLMAGVPADISVDDVSHRLCAIDGVLKVQCLHVWAMANDKRNMWAHLTVATGADSTAVLKSAQRVAARYSCHHTCFQLQDVETYDPRDDGDCFTPHAQV